MEKLTREFIHVLYRFHQSSLKVKGLGDVANVEFFILMGIAAMLDENACEFFGNLENDEGITLGYIANELGMTMSALSKKISILEKKGWITRTSSHKDRRVTYINLTEEGKKICEKERYKKQLWIDEIIHRMGEDNMQELLQLSNQIFDVLEEMIAHQNSYDGKEEETC